MIIPKKTFDHKLVTFPPIIVPNDHYFIKQSDGSVKHYIGALDGTLKLVSDSSVPLTSSPYSLISTTAGETISGGKVVSIHEDNLAYVYNINDENDYFRMYGIAKQAAILGGTLEVFISGEVTEVGSGWQFGKTYFVSSTGLLTENVPVLGIIKKIATGMSTDKVFLTNITTDLITI